MTLAVRAALWLALTMTGSWVIWASFLAVKFITEDAQGQRASFSIVHTGTAPYTGGFVFIPAILTVAWAVVSFLLAAGLNVRYEPGAPGA